MSYNPNEIPSELLELIRVKFGTSASFEKERKDIQKSVNKTRRTIKKLLKLIMQEKEWIITKGKAKENPEFVSLFTDLFPLCEKMMSFTLSIQEKLLLPETFASFDAYFKEGKKEQAPQQIIVNPKTETPPERGGVRGLPSGPVAKTGWFSLTAETSK